ncbi:MAG TPA: tRNA (adenosine(37)-N6)-threonylcarbamoyltransferase complex transferase subunit TsaD [Firmicutes bacterium]|nr:tRNA (adenosine(37)-N6)-threonylcarbamoyltransferase complex transferase subunit TsaD [Bacillota bacterium]
MIVFGIETSCDDTSFAVVENGVKILSNIISSQEIHKEYGGVVPELASREHIRNILYVYERGISEAGVSLKDADGIAVTNRPGLIVSLLVGLNFAKGLAFGSGKPFVGVNHTLAHVYSNHLSETPPEFPYVCLILSGGHTILGNVRSYTDMEIIGQTRDDAIGEAFDKVSKFLGLGYPGGPVIEKLAKDGDPDKTTFPIPRFKEPSLDFSYSGLKTAVLNFYRTNPGIKKEDLAAGFQKTAVKILLNNLSSYLEIHNTKRIAVTGGVSANNYLRTEFRRFCDERNLSLFLPEKKLCTDNAAMIAGLGTRLLESGKSSGLSLDAVSRGLN